MRSAVAWVLIGYSITLLRGIEVIQVFGFVLPNSGSFSRLAHPAGELTLEDLRERSRLRSPGRPKGSTWRNNRGPRRPRPHLPMSQGHRRTAETSRCNAVSYGRGPAGLEDNPGGWGTRGNTSGRAADGGRDGTAPVATRPQGDPGTRSAKCGRKIRRSRRWPLKTPNPSSRASSGPDRTGHH
jgi:hypothetical protein